MPTLSSPAITTMFRRNERTVLRTRLGGRECPIGQIEPESLPSWVSIVTLMPLWEYENGQQTKNGTRSLSHLSTGSNGWTPFWRSSGPILVAGYNRFLASTSISSQYYFRHCFATSNKRILRKHVLRFISIATIVCSAGGKREWGTTCEQPSRLRRSGKDLTIQGEDLIQL